MTAEARFGCGGSATSQPIPRNPFVTRNTLPGRIPPLDSDGWPVDPRTLLDRLGTLGGTAAIQGPHGSGKTTLLTHLARELEDSGSLAAVVRLRLRRDFVVAFRAIVRARSRQTVCIDSWERMGTVPACLARLAAMAMGCGLLVTSHRETGLPLLARCVPTPALLAAIVRRLPGHGDWFGSLISADDIEAAFSASGGNLREALYCLYDRFERGVRP